MVLAFNTFMLYICLVIVDLYENYGLFERLTKLEADFPGANVILHKIAVLPEVSSDSLK